MMARRVFIADVAGLGLIQSARGIAWWLGAFRPSEIYRPPLLDRLFISGLMQSVVEAYLRRELDEIQGLSEENAFLVKRHVFLNTVNSLLPSQFFDRLVPKFDFEAEAPKSADIIDVEQEIKGFNTDYPKLKKNYDPIDFEEMSIREIIDDNLVPILNNLTVQSGLSSAKIDVVSADVKTVDKRVAKLDTRIAKLDAHFDGVGSRVGNVENGVEKLGGEVSRMDDKLNKIIRHFKIS